jgi:hypothetical protein
VHQMRIVMAVLGTALAFAVCFVMLAQVIGFASPWLALLLMFYFMALAKVAEPIFVLRMPATLGRVQRWEQSGSIYRQLGVRLFGRLLRGTPLRFFNAKVYLSSGSKDLHSLHRQAASIEATHFWAAVLFMPYIGYLFISAQPWIATFFLVVQALFNVYPILHLRLLRGRLDVVLQRQHGHLERSHATAAGDA